MALMGLKAPQSHHVPPNTIITCFLQADGLGERAFLDWQWFRKTASESAEMAE